jgi:hypothetical protein
MPLVERLRFKAWCNMIEETLEYLEKVLSGLRARYAAGEKGVEVKLRAVAAKVDQLRLQKDLVKPGAPIKTFSQQLKHIVRRRSCCR